MEERPLLIDGHVDLTYFLMNLPEPVALPELDKGPVTLPKMHSAGLRLFCNALYCEDRFNGSGAKAHVRRLVSFTLERLAALSIVKGRRDLEELEGRPGQPRVLLLLENGDALTGDPDLVSELVKGGIRIVGLTHAGKNRLADGNAVRVSAGLTAQGREVLKVLEHRGVAIDAAHLHPVCFGQLLDLFRGPILSSHTGVRTLCDLPRNLDLDQAAEIARRGGILGITCNPEMLRPDGRADLKDVFNHIDVLVQRFGPDGVGIGSDFCGFDRAAEGLEDIARLPALAALMAGHGYGQEAIAKIMGRNWHRFYRTLYPV